MFPYELLNSIAAIMGNGHGAERHDDQCRSLLGSSTIQAVPWDEVLSWLPHDERYSCQLARQRPGARRGRIWNAVSCPGGFLLAIGVTHAPLPLML